MVEPSPVRPSASPAARSSESITEEQIQDEKDAENDGVAMPRPYWPHARLIHDILASSYVEGFLVVLILLSFVCIIVETDRAAVDLEPLAGVEILNYIILALYTVELMLKLYVFRSQYFRVPWNLVDVTVVFTDYLMLVLEAVVPAGFSLKFARILRLARLSRSARAVHYFPQMALMVQGLWATLRIVWCGLVLLVSFLIIIGVLGVQLLHPINMRVAEKGIYDGCERCPRAFESTWQAVLTFTQQIVTGDSWGLVSLPIIEEEPLSVLFLGVVFISLNLMVMNVILSMVVDSSLKASEEDTQRMLREKEKAAKEHASHLMAMCAELDEDHSGCLTKDELLGGFQTNPMFRDMMTLMDFSLEDIDAVFNILDKDGSGDVNYDEFVKELYKMKSHDSHTLLVFIKYYVSEIKDLMTFNLQAEFEQLNKAVGVHETTCMPKLQSKAVEEAKAQAPSAEKRDSVHELLVEIRQTLQVEVAQIVQELSRQASDNHSNLVEQLKESAPLKVGLAPDTWALGQPPAPYSVPQPSMDEAPLQPAPAPRLPPGQRIGPMCHYVGRSKVDSIQNSHSGGVGEGGIGAMSREAGPPSAGRRNLGAFMRGTTPSG